MIQLIDLHLLTEKNCSNGLVTGSRLSIAAREEATSGIGPSGARWRGVAERGELTEGGGLYRDSVALTGRREVL